MVMIRNGQGKYGENHERPGEPRQPRRKAREVGFPPRDLGWLPERDPSTKQCPEPQG